MYGSLASEKWEWLVIPEKMVENINYCAAAGWTYLYNICVTGWKRFQKGKGIEEAGVRGYWDGVKRKVAGKRENWLKMRYVNLSSANQPGNKRVIWSAGHKSPTCNICLKSLDFVRSCKPQRSTWTLSWNVFVWCFTKIVRSKSQIIKSPN